MTKQQALEIAKARYADYQKASIEHMFRGAAAPVDSEYGYKHGWVIVGDFSFNNEDLTGIPYDASQGGWAWL